MNRRRLWAIIRKDLKEVLGTGQIVLPMIIVPLVFVIFLPSVVILSSGSLVKDPDTAQMIDNMPRFLTEQLSGFSEQQMIAYFMLVFIFSSFFLIIPIMVSTLIAANSFAGEKERKTLEGLLYTPVTDMELVVGKILTAWMPSLAVSWLCFVIYAVVVNVLGYRLFEGVFFPTANWFALMLVLVPAVAFASIALVVMISSKVRGFQEANQIAGALVLPLVLMTVGQFTGVVVFSTIIVIITGAAFAVVDVILLLFILSVFHRDRLLT